MSSEAPPEEATETTTPETPPIGSPHDLSAFQTPPFRYKLRTLDAAGNPTKEEKVFSVDFEMAALELHSLIPTALQPYGKTEDGSRMEYGLEHAMRCLKEGKPHPTELPTVPHILDAISKALKVPAEYGMQVKLAVLRAWLTENARRVDVKKSTPRSPKQPASTPA